MHFNISGISPPNFTPPKDRKQSFNICSKKYNIFVLASSVSVMVAQKGTNEPYAFYLTDVCD
jgi:hypothetical protein